MIKSMTLFCIFTDNFELESPHFNRKLLTGLLHNSVDTILDNFIKFSSVKFYKIFLLWFRKIHSLKSCFTQSLICIDMYIG